MVIIGIYLIILNHIFPSFQKCQDNFDYLFKRAVHSMTKLWTDTRNA